MRYLAALALALALAGCSLYRGGDEARPDANPDVCLRPVDGRCGDAGADAGVAPDAHACGGEGELCCDEAPACDEGLVCGLPGAIVCWNPG